MHKTNFKELLFLILCFQEMFLFKQKKTALKFIKAVLNNLTIINQLLSFRKPKRSIQ